MPFSPALPVFLLLLSGGAGPSHPVRAPGCRGGRQSHWRQSSCLGLASLSLAPRVTAAACMLWGLEAWVLPVQHCALGLVSTSPGPVCAS